MTAIEFVQAKNYTVAADVPHVAAWGGRERTINAITIHHWGALGQSHDGVVAWFRDSAPTSAHYVVSAGRITQMVRDEDAAWHAGNATGNLTTIGIECRPEATGDDYATVAVLVKELRSKYGPLPLYPHNHWTATGCPGVWDLVKIDTLANAGASSITVKKEGGAVGWKALATLNRSAARNAGWCLSFAQAFTGAPIANPSAWAAWLGTKYKHGVGEALPNVPVVLWFEHWGTYGTPPTYDNWGHVAVWVPGEGIYTSPAAGYGREVYQTIGEIEAYFSCRYVGWSEDLNGLRVARYEKATAALAQPPLTATQRRVGATLSVQRRKTPDRKFAALDGPLKPGEVGNFIGWVHGEMIGNNDVWFVGTSGNYFWSGGFTSQAITGLRDMNKPKPTPTQMLTFKAGNTNSRRDAGVDKAWVKTYLDEGKPRAATVIGRKLGKDPNGKMTEWYKLLASTPATPQWIWSGRFTKAPTVNLPWL